MVQSTRYETTGGGGVRWYWIALLVCLVIGPFDALYVYIKAQKRRDELKRRREEQEQTNKSQTEDDRE